MSTIPGSTALTVTPAGASSSASVRTMPSRPAFAAEYEAWPRSPPVAAPEEMTTSRPRRRSRIPASAGCSVRNAPVRLTSSSCRQAAGATFSARAMWSTIAALATTAPIGPSSPAARPWAAAEAAASVTSHVSASARPPTCSIARAVASTSRSRSQAATAHPSLASRSAMARPIPRAAPVTSAQPRSVTRAPPWRARSAPSGGPGCPPGPCTSTRCRGRDRSRPGGQTGTAACRTT